MTDQSIERISGATCTVVNSDPGPSRVGTTPNIHPARRHIGIRRVRPSAGTTASMRSRCRCSAWHRCEPGSCVSSLVSTRHWQGPPPR
eukprot:3431181-Pyramimonas_sp.AAC.1